MVQQGMIQQDCLKVMLKQHEGQQFCFTELDMRSERSAYYIVY